MKKQITTIIFDLSEVLLTGLKETGDEIAKELKLSPKEVERLFRNGGLEDFFHGLSKEEEFLEKAIKKYKWNYGIENLKKRIRRNFRKIDGTRQIIERLKSKNFKLGLLSIHGKEWVEHCERKYNYHRLFNSVVYSFDIGLSKPDKKAYSYILNKLHAKPGECLFIDDSLGNVKAAESLGIRGIVFKNSIQLKKELNKVGIKF